MEIPEGYELVKVLSPEEGLQLANLNLRKKSASQEMANTELTVENFMLIHAGSGQVQVMVNEETGECQIIRKAEEGDSCSDSDSSAA